MKTIAALSFALFGLAPIAASATDDVMIVYDGSNSMWGQVEGVSKIEIARDVMAGLVETWPQSTNLGLLAYGHRREGDCTDIELMDQRQEEYHYEYRYAYRPSVTLSDNVMHVEGMSRGIRVHRID